MFNSLIHGKDALEEIKLPTVAAKGGRKQRGVKVIDLKDAQLSNRFKIGHGKTS